MNIQWVQLYQSLFQDRLQDEKYYLYFEEYQVQKELFAYYKNIKVSNLPESKHWQPLSKVLLLTVASSILGLWMVQINPQFFAHFSDPTSLHTGFGIFSIGLALAIFATVFFLQAAPVTALRFSPDGKHLFFWVTGPEGGLHRLTLADQKVKRILKLPGIHIRGRGGIDYEWSPDEKWIAYTTRTGSSSYNIWIIPSEGGEAKNITQLSALHSQPTWSVDGKYMYFQSNRSGEGLYRVALQPDLFRNTDVDQRFVKPSKKPEI